MVRWNATRRVSTFLAIDPDSSVPNEGIWTSREFITLIEGFREMAAPGRIVSVFRKT
jgi:hypothetical protein